MAFPSHSSASAKRASAGKAQAASFPTGTCTRGSSIRTANPSARSFAPGSVRFNRSRTSSNVRGPAAKMSRAFRTSRPGSTRAPRAFRIVRIPAPSTGCSAGRSVTKSLALATCSVPRRKVARTTFRSTSSLVRASRRNPSTRAHRPRKGGRGHWACIPTSLSIARSGVTSSRASSICRASVARLSWRSERVLAVAIPKPTYRRAPAGALPMATSSRSPRTSIIRPAIAGVAMSGCPIRLRATSSNCGPAFTTKTSPSSPER